MTDLYFYSSVMSQAAASLQRTQDFLEPLAVASCAPSPVGLIFGPRTPGLQAAAELSQTVAAAATFAALMTQYAAGLVSRFETAAAVFSQLEAGA